MKKMPFLKILFLWICLFLLSNISNAKTIYYVTQNGTGDGSSWAKAAGNIQNMIDKAVSGDEVWVAKGTYYPPTIELIARDPRSRNFILPTGVKLFGGFAGTETAISKRLLSDLDNNGKVDSCELVNTTILSGDIDGIPDVWTKTTTYTTWKWTITGNTGNSYCVVNGSGYIDGFYVSGGSGIENADNYIRGSGGGISGPSVKNCIVTNCSGDYGGGIISHSVTNCIVKDCFARKGGGGIFVETTYSNPNFILTNCTITNCSAVKNGGGIYMHSNSYESKFQTVTNCTITNCSAGSSGGGIFASVTEPASLGIRLSVTNCLFTNCSAVYGGGIYSNSGTGWNNLINCTLTNCSGNASGGGIYTPETAVIGLTNCIVANCYAANSGGGIKSNSFNSSFDFCAFSNNKSGNDIGNGVSENEGFISPEISLAYTRPTSFIGAATTELQKAELLSADWHLKECSPCINAGTKEDVPISVLSGKDLDGNSRVLYGAIDIGAYEYDVPKINMPLYENFDEVTIWDNSSVFFNSSQIFRKQNITWTLTGQKAVFSWQTNLSYSYSCPIFTYQIDGTKASKVFLRYDMYFQAYSGTFSPLGTEKLNIKFSTDTRTWNTVASYSNANGTIANKNYKHNISSLAAGKTFFIQFEAIGSNSNRIEKWEIDNVVIDTDGTTAKVRQLSEDRFFCLVNDGILRIANLKEGSTVKLFDLNGRLLRCTESLNNSAQFVLPVHGVYIVRSESKSGAESQKVVW